MLEYCRCVLSFKTMQIFPYGDFHLHISPKRNVAKFMVQCGFQEGMFSFVYISATVVCGFYLCFACDDVIETCL